MSKAIFFTVLVGLTTAFPQVPLAKPVFPENVSRSLTSTRIINGWEAGSASDFPYQVRVIARLSSVQNTVCGGAILSTTFVLTAAHCTNGMQSFDLGFGSIYYNAPATQMTATTKIIHPSYNSANLNNDISLIKLPTALPIVSNIKSIQLPRYSHASDSFANRQGTVTGFGITRDGSPQLSNRLKAALVRVIGNSECSGVYGTDVVRDFSLCTRGWDNNKDGACKGDSGGPLITYDSTSGGPMLIGVVTFMSSTGCESGYPVGHARVTSYLKWISDNTGISIRP